MLRDQTEATSDMKVLDDFEIEDLNQETINSYRNLHKTQKSGHVWTLLDDAEFLKNIGAAAVSKSDRKLHPTAAGLLMFGNEYDIAREFPEYFLDYRGILDASIRWVDRLQSSSGEWSGNLFDFYFRVYNKLIKDVKVPFKIEGGERAGSGVPDIFRVWDDAQLEEPIIEERFGEAARTTFKLLFVQKKATEKMLQNYNEREKYPVTGKTSGNS